MKLLEFRNIHKKFVFVRKAVFAIKKIIRKIIFFLEIHFVAFSQFGSVLSRICLQNLAKKSRQVRENGLLTAITGFISLRLRKFYLPTVTWRRRVSNTYRDDLIQ